MRKNCSNRRYKAFKRAEGGLARAREAQLVAEAKQAEGRITQTKQFQQLKRMLAEKNGELVELRRRLQRYENDGCKLVDDDD